MARGKFLNVYVSFFFFLTLTAYSILVLLWMHRLQMEKLPFPISSLMSYSLATELPLTGTPCKMKKRKKIFWDFYFSLAQMKPRQNIESTPQPFFFFFSRVFLPKTHGKIPPIFIFLFSENLFCLLFFSLSLFSCKALRIRLVLYPHKTEFPLPFCPCWTREIEIVGGVLSLTMIENVKCSQTESVDRRSFENQTESKSTYLAPGKRRNQLLAVPGRAAEFDFRNDRRRRIVEKKKRGQI